MSDLANNIPPNLKRAKVLADRALNNYLDGKLGPVSRHYETLRELLLTIQHICAYVHDGGTVRVPQSPDDWMQAAGMEKVHFGADITDVWAAMLSASPLHCENADACMSASNAEALVDRLRVWAAANTRSNCSEVLAIADELAALTARQASPQQGAAQSEAESSPTTGMTLGERIAHVGGRENAAGYVEFGSPMAVQALINHVLRDLPATRASSSAQAVTDAARDVMAERQRQMSAESWTPEHDDEHGPGCLSAAAASYAIEATSKIATSRHWAIAYHDMAGRMWPFDFEWWKPKDARRDLVRAGALILAEIERIDRAQIAQAKRGDAS